MRRNHLRKPRLSASSSRSRSFPRLMAVGLSLCCLCATARVDRVWGQASGPGDWFMFHHDAAHLGRSPFIGPSTPAKRWEFPSGDVGDVIRSSVAIAKDGTIYVGSDDAKVHAINSTNGQEKDKWPFTTGASVRGTPAIGSDGTVYIGSDDKSVYAINPDATKKWSFATTDKVRSSPVIGGDGTIYVGSDDGNLYALTATGTKKWAFVVGSAVESSPALGSDGTIYVGASDSKVYAINSDGTKRWIFTTGGVTGLGLSGVYSSPAVGPDGTIYVGSDKLYALNGDGTKKWDFLAGGSIASSPAIGFDGTIYVGALDSKVYAITPTGTKKWTFATGGFVLSSPAVGADSTVYVGSEDKKLYALNADGTELWEFLARDVIDSSPAVGADGTIYVGSGDKKLYAIGPGEGGSLTPPQVIAFQPAGTQAPISSLIVVTFTKPMNRDATAAALSISPPVIGATSWSPNGKILTFTLAPPNLLKANKTYTVTVSGTAKDVVGNTLDGNGNGVAEGSPTDDFKWQFTTNNSTVTVNGITPNTGINSDIVNITNLSGTDFRSGAVVKLSAQGKDDIVAVNVQVANSTKITCSFDLRAKEPGTYDVTVTNTNGQSGTLPAAFTVTGAALSVVSITPNSAAVDTKPLTDIRGTGFDRPSVKLAKAGQADILPKKNEINAIGTTRILADFNLTGAAFGKWDVVVTNTDGTTSTLPQGFTVQPATSVPNAFVKLCSDDDTKYGTQSSQTVEQGMTACYSVKVRNDGNSPQAFTIKASESGAPGWVTLYQWQAVDLTAGITSAGGWTGPTLQPGVSFLLNVSMTPVAGVTNGSMESSIITAIGKNNSVSVVMTTKATVTGSMAAHDVALTEFFASPNPVSPGQIVTFTAKAKNLGTNTESGVTFRMTLNSRTIFGPLKLPTGKPGQEIIRIIKLAIPKTIPKGDYLITGELSPVPGEINTNNNRQTIKLTVN